MKTYCIYKHVSPCGKVYIGQTCQSVKHRWLNGRGYTTCIIFNRAIKKYGWDNMEHQVLFTGLDKLNANIIEEDLIYYYKSIGKSYNITDGGEGTAGVHRSLETRRKLSIAKTGVSQTEEHIRNASNGRKKPIIQYSLNDEFIREWDSAKDIMNELGIDNSCIAKCCKGKRQTAANFKWKYKEN